LLPFDAGRALVIALLLLAVAGAGAASARLGRSA